MSSGRLRFLACVLFGCSRSTLFPLDGASSAGSGATAPSPTTQTQPGTAQGEAAGSPASGPGQSADGRGAMIIGPRGASSPGFGSSAAGAGPAGAPDPGRPGARKPPTPCSAGELQYCMCSDGLTLGISHCSASDAGGRGVFGPCEQCAPAAQACMVVPNYPLYGECRQALCACNPKAASCDEACWQAFFSELRDYIGCIGHNCTGGDTACIDAACSPYLGEVEQATQSMTCALDLAKACLGMPPAGCGNGVRDFGELCDGSDLGGSSCSAFGFSEGTLRCGPDCTYDTRGCFSLR